MAVVANWGSDGWYEVWADLDGDGSMTRVLDRQTGIDFAAGAGPTGRWGSARTTTSRCSTGPCRVSLAGTIYTDYANAQITEWAEP